jgi:NADPH:quinone reductase-like Zn-dependent oxidoreductase
VARRHRPPDPGRLLSILVRQQMGTFINKENARDLITLRERIDASTLTPALDRTYPLEEVPAAIRYLLDGHTRGKIAIAVQDADPT